MTKRSVSGWWHSPSLSAGKWSLACPSSSVLHSKGRHWRSWACSNGSVVASMWRHWWSLACPQIGVSCDLGPCEEVMAVSGLSWQLNLSTLCGDAVTYHLWAGEVTLAVMGLSQQLSFTRSLQKGKHRLWRCGFSLLPGWNCLGFEE